MMNKQQQNRVIEHLKALMYHARQSQLVYGLNSGQLSVQHANHFYTGIKFVVKTLVHYIFPSPKRQEVEEYIDLYSPRDKEHIKEKEYISTDDIEMDKEIKEKLS